MTRLMIALALLLPSACLQSDPQPKARLVCDAAALSGLIGEPRAVMDGMTFHGPVRVIRPGQPITMDHDPSRLNVNVKGGMITRIWCG